MKPPDVDSLVESVARAMCVARGWEPDGLHDDVEYPKPNWRVFISLARSALATVTTDAPYFARCHLKCARCNHAWEDWLAQNVAASVWTAVAKDIVRRGCPACGKKRHAVCISALRSERNAA